MGCLRNQICTLMMSLIGGASQFKTLSSIGIKTEAASANNISTANINKLEFDKSRLEQKFQYMDMMIAKMQEQFSTFLGA